MPRSRSIALSPVPGPVGRRAGRWVVAGLVACTVAAATAGPPARGPGSALARLLGRPDPSSGYLALVGTPPLRWLEPAEPAAAVAPPPVTLYSPDTGKAAGGPPDPPAAPAGAPAANGEPPKPPPLRPEDFLPFFQRGPNEPPSPASADDGQRFVPAHSPSLPSSSAEYRSK